jgi:glycosyltransferase involved in cell wall biosynthesis
MSSDTALPEVSVCILTYNQAKYISQAIDSAVGQKVNFNYEILIFDDGSEDGTTAILENYAGKFPEKIKVFLSDRNSGNYSNAYRMKQNVRGKYIAFLDGDDKWLNENKLQQQIDFLNNHLDFAGAFHDAVIESSYLNEAQEQDPNRLYKGFKYYSQMYRYNDVYYPHDSIKRTIIPHSSLILRRKPFDDALAAFPKINFSGSWLLQLLAIQNSKFKYTNEQWSLYRDHPQGFTKMNAVSRFNSGNIEILKYLLSNPYYKLHKSLYLALGEEYNYFAYSSEFGRLSWNKKLGILAGFGWYYFLYVLKETNYHLRWQKNS